LQPARIAALLFHLLETAELDSDAALRLGGVHSAREKLPGLHLDVEFQFLIEFVVSTLPEQHGAQPKLEIPPGHDVGRLQ
jgi:hypothetical protein